MEELAYSIRNCASIDLLYFQGDRMLDKLKNMFSKNKIPATVSKEKSTDAKAEATKKKEVYVTVLNVELIDFT